MKNTGLKILIVAAALAPIGAIAQQAAAPTLKAPEIPTTATYITKEEIDKVRVGQTADKSTDENVKIVDLGYENMSLGSIHRGVTHNPPPPRPAGTTTTPGRPVEASVPCGKIMATAPADAVHGGIIHDFQTEAYYITSGGGEMYTGGTIVNGRHVLQNLDGGPNGPTCEGLAIDVKKRTVKVGDVIIIPPGIVHGWSEIPDHVDYISFRPSQKAMQAGWVSPRIR